MHCPGYRTREGQRLTEPHEAEEGDFYVAKGKRDRVCKACRRTIQRRYERRHEQRVRDSKAASARRRRPGKYGITQDRVDELVAVQEGKCPICLLERPLEIDHNHATGVVRMLLCGQCNRAEGLLDGDADRAERLARYLRIMADG